MCVYYLFIAHFLTGHYLAKLFIPLKTINPFPRNDIAQCIFQEVYCQKPLAGYISFPSPSSGDEEKQIVINQEFPTIQQRQ